MSEGSNREWCSSTIGKISGALAKAQAEFGRLIADKSVKNKDGTPRYSYADLGDALEACRSCLNKHEIAVVQMPAATQRNGIEVTTVLVHSSGEWLRSDPLFMPVSGGAQDVGSAITYGRRYSLLAMVGLAPEDDDGAKAQGAKPKAWSDRRDRSDQEQPAQRTRASARDAGPRCNGKAAGIARAIAALVQDVAEATGETLGQVWLAAIEDLDLANYGGDRPTKPEQLLVSDGNTVKARLRSRLEDQPRVEPDHDHNPDTAPTAWPDGTRSKDDPTSEGAP